MPTNTFKHTRLLLLDVDGVLTDGSILFNGQGSEIKVFNVKDGLGIRLLMKAGIRVGVVTGRRSQALNQRCRDLGIDIVFDGISDKAAVWDDILAQTGTEAFEIAFMGDDLPDLPLMKRAGLSIAVADAHESVRNRADHITTVKGGRGAVREVCETILKAQGLWDRTLEGFNG